jgi:two-component system response regulator ChvI
MGADEQRIVMNTPSPAYRRQPFAARTGRSVPAVGYAARTGWLKQTAPAEKSAWHIAETEASLLSKEASTASESNILFLNPSVLDASSREMLERLSELGLQLPVAALAGDAVDDFNASLDEGSQKRLVERLHVIAELLKGDSETRAPAADAKLQEHGQLRLDFKTCRAYWQDQPVNLTITEFNIVNLFSSRIGENLSYREIYDVVHGIGFCAGDGTHGYQTNVRSLIKRIRQKFHAIDASFDDIENHRGYGYRWRERAALSTPARPEIDEPSFDGGAVAGLEQARVLMVYVVNPGAK